MNFHSRSTLIHPLLARRGRCPRSSLQWRHPVSRPSSTSPTVIFEVLRLPTRLPQLTRLRYGPSTVWTARRAARIYRTPMGPAMSHQCDPNTIRPDKRTVMGHRPSITLVSNIPILAVNRCPVSRERHWQKYATQRSKIIADSSLGTDPGDSWIDVRTTFSDGSNQPPFIDLANYLDPILHLGPL